MSDDKPFGWRPLTDEQKESFRSSGWSEEQISGIEKTNTYSPDPTAIDAVHLGLALLRAGTKHLGEAFAHSVRSELERSARRLSSSEAVEDQVEAPIVRSLIDALDWDRIIARASSTDG